MVSVTEVDVTSAERTPEFAGETAESSMSAKVTLPWSTWLVQPRMSPVALSIASNPEFATGDGLSQRKVGVGP